MDSYLKFLLLESPFFSKKNVPDFAQNSLRWSSQQINFPNFGIFFQIPTTREAFFSKKKCLWFCSKFAQMKFRPNKFSEFWNIRDFFGKLEKNPIPSWKIGIFFSKKSFSKFAENWLRWSSGQINFRNFGTFAIFFRKLEKNPIPSWKFRNFFVKNTL